MTPYRFVPHTADIAVELVAPDEAGLRAAGIDALRELLVGTSAVRALEERPIEPQGLDPTERLVRFLAEALYLYDTERFVPARAGRAGVLGEPFDPARHEAAPAGWVTTSTAGFGCSPRRSRSATCDRACGSLSIRCSRPSHRAWARGGPTSAWIIASSIACCATAPAGRWPTGMGATRTWKRSR